jgi:hypothetical protein
MFWTIDDDRNENYSFSNSEGPQLHRYPASTVQRGDGTDR